MPAQDRQPHGGSDDAMRADPWLFFSSGLALGLGSAALALTTNVALVSSLALVPPVAFAGFATVGLLGTRPQGRSSGGTEVAPAPAPNISFSAVPVVSIGDRRLVAGVVLEPSFAGDGRQPAGAPAWERMPPRLVARLETTLLDRAALLAEHLHDDGRREAVLISVALASLADRAFLARLGRALDRPEDDRPRLMILVRGGEGDLAAVTRLPRAWRDHVGLRLTAPPGDDAAVAACLGAGLGCLEIDAASLTRGAAGSGRLVELAAGLADADVPVLVAGVTDEAPLARLHGLPTLFARGPLFDGLPALAA
jgi:hypothetical protein